MSWHELCSSPRAEGAVEGNNGNACVVFESNIIPQQTIIAFMFNTFKLNPTSPTQMDKHYITFIAFVCF